MTITEGDLFAEILAAYAVEQYDPAVHLNPEDFAAAWHVDIHTARERLRKDSRLEELRVLSPKTGKAVLMFRRK